MCWIVVCASMFVSNIEREKKNKINFEKRNETIFFVPPPTHTPHPLSFYLFQQNWNIENKKGLVIGAFEWLAPLILLLLWYLFFLVYDEAKVTTMPEFISRWFNEHCRTYLTVKKSKREYVGVVGVEWARTGGEELFLAARREVEGTWTLWVIFYVLAIIFLLLIFWCVNFFHSFRREGKPDVSL